MFTFFFPSLWVALSCFHCLAPASTIPMQIESERRAEEALIEIAFASCTAATSKQLRPAFTSSRNSSRRTSTSCDMAGGQQIVHIFVQFIFPKHFSNHNLREDTYSCPHWLGWCHEREKIDWQEAHKFDCQLVRTIFIFCCPLSIFTRHCQLARKSNFDS